MRTTFLVSSFQICTDFMPKGDDNPRDVKATRSISSLALRFMRNLQDWEMKNSNVELDHFTNKILCRLIMMHGDGGQRIMTFFLLSPIMRSF